MDEFSFARTTRRRFIKSGLVAGTFTALSSHSATSPIVAQTNTTARRIKLGFDNFAVRAFNWKAMQVLDYAATLKVDAVMLSDLDVYESLDDKHLKLVKARADSLGIEIHAGTGSICPSAKSFNPKHGTAPEHLALAIRVARTLGSKVVRCYLGTAADRQTPGGIDAHMNRTVAVCKAVRAQAKDANVRIAIENHAGDMQSHELVRLIEAAGRDYVGATMDAGNAAWTLEDPRASLEVLAPFTLTTSIRDSAFWETEDGARVQWTAMGEGAIDWADYMRRFAELCPGVPVFLETISGVGRAFPYLKPEFWQHYPNARAADFARFVRLAKRNQVLEPFKVAANEDKRQAEQVHQRNELERSLKFCREKLNLGIKAA